MIIELEDGRRVELDDNSSPQQIDEVITHLSSSPAQNPPRADQPIQPQPAMTNPASMGESLARGYLQGGSMGFGDEIMGGIGAGVAKLAEPELFKDQSYGDLYKTARDSSRQDEAVAQQSNPWTYGGGQLAGTVASAAKIPMPASAGRQIAVGAGLGGIAGYGSSDADTGIGQLADTGMGMATGIGGTYIGQKIGQGVGALANSRVGQNTKDTVKGILAKFYAAEPKAAGSYRFDMGSDDGDLTEEAITRMAKENVDLSKFSKYDPMNDPDGYYADIAKKYDIHFDDTNEAAYLTPKTSPGSSASAGGASSASPAVEAMKNGATPQEADMIAMATRFGVPLSRGDVTRNVNQQGMEDLALRGALGDDAASVATNFRRDQSTALRDSAKNTMAQISGTPYMENTAEAGATLGARLKAMAAQQNGAVGAAYDNVGAAGPARIAVPLINKHLSSAYDELQQFPLDTMPSTNSVMKRAQEVFATNPNGQFTAPADLTKIDNFRKFMNRAGESVQMGNNSDKAGITIIKKRLDAAVDEAVEQNLVFGNPEAVTKLKNARDLSRQYFKTWQSGDVVQNIVDNTYTPEQVVNLVRGYGQVGGNKQAALLIDKLGGILGKESPEFGQLKQAQLQQLFGKNLDALMTGDLQKGFNAEEVRRNISQLFANNKSLANAYFSPEEQRTLKDFLEVSYRATNRVPGAVNTSNTTTALVRYGKQFANQFGVLGRLLGAPAELVGQGMAGIKKGADAQQAIDSFGKFKNPDNALAVALRNKISTAGGIAGAAGGSYAGQQTSTKKPLTITVRPQPKDLKSFYQ